MGPEAEMFPVEQSVPLAPLTTLGVGGPARWFATITKEAEIPQALAFAAKRDLPVFVLGGGSNVLVADDGFPGLVLHIGLRGVIDNRSRGSQVHITAAAGENWDALVQYAVERDLQGIECLAGIPGTVGGTPVQNVGAYGQEIAQTFVSAHCYDTLSKQFVELTPEDMGFAYRTSLLNTAERGRYIVAAVTLALTYREKPNLSYADLQRAFADKPDPSLREVADAVRLIRRGKGMVVDPNDPDSRSAGSFFRNPIVALAQLDAVAAAAELPSSQVPHWPAGDGQIKLPAAWLLERAGFVRGYSMGNAGISSKHTLALVNRGGATTSDIAALRDRIVAEVARRFGITLEQEPVNVA